MSKNVLHIMDRTGHTDVMFDPKVNAEVKAASDAFMEKIQEGYQAFKVDGDNKATRISNFDETSERTLLFPQLVGG